MSEKNMDDLLAQLKTEFEPERKSRQKATKPAAKQLNQPPQNTKSSASMEDMLAELRSELESGRGRSDRNDIGASNKQKSSVNSAKSEKVSSRYRNRLNDLIDRDYQIQASKREAKLAELERQEQNRIAAEKHRQQEIIKAQQREKLREKRRKEALREKAQQWLKNLNMRSEEGKWFEEFSFSYENKLEAAIDYLEAMRESGL